uniref:Protein kinase domain-containing protein n=1 Tax=Anisakis simplex TaxID=6269 RepID=A0A0M3KI69_ANISI
LIDFGVDRSTKPIALFALTSDKRVIRFSSAKAPDYLTVASEPVEEFGARTLISSLQKTTRLLPYAPTSAILQRLTSNSELHALTTLPIPLISNILRTANDLSHNYTFVYCYCSIQVPIRTILMQL